MDAWRGALELASAVTEFGVSRKKIRMEKGCCRWRMKKMVDEKLL